MAKPKVKVMVNVRSNIIADVYTDNIDEAISEILSIEGVSSASVIVGRISVITDPRYDINEIAEEIKELLLSEVPDVFKE